MDLKGINRYQHFGLSTAWLEHFFEMRNECWNSNQLGNRQYDSLRVWLREAEIIDSNARGGEFGQITPIGESLIELGPYNPLTWAIIWTHLVHNSILMKWYAFCVPAGESYDRNDFIAMLGDSFAEATRANAILSLAATFNAPVKFTCNDAGKGSISFQFRNEDELTRLISVFDTIKARRN